MRVGKKPLFLATFELDSSLQVAPLTHMQWLNRSRCTHHLHEMVDNKTLRTILIL